MNKVSVDGILNIFKPSGRTSFSVVSLLRRLSGERRVGHTGTLDPEATGVLVVCFGQATKVIRFLARAKKTYQAEIELGLATDSYDATGRVVKRGDPSSVNRDQVEQVLNCFRGPIEQVPPMYSAVKREGKRLYRLAWEGIEVPRKPRTVQIFRLELMEWQSPIASIEVECSAGTYIRSLAQDIGVALGCGAHLKKLVRLKNEPFHISEAVSLPLIEEAFHHGYWDRFLYPIDEVLLGWEATILSKENEMLVDKGRTVCLQGERLLAHPVNRCRAYSADGRFLAVLRQETIGLWHPEKVFHSIHL
ncbi:MAG: tRNA pseudouridine(55) synthase TruB [Chloroflexi bacterium]|nr:tRNA pseudouridine(55) synthase TruB [Chloroflexota bacterium]